MDEKSTDQSYVDSSTRRSATFILYISCPKDRTEDRGKILEAIGLKEWTGAVQIYIDSSAITPAYQPITDIVLLLHGNKKIGGTQDNCKRTL